MLINWPYNILKNTANQWTAWGVLTKISSAFLVSKLTAIYLGPAGMATWAQFKNFYTIAENIASLGIQNTVLQQTTQYKQDLQILQNKLKNILVFAFISWIIIVIGLLYSASFWSWILFHNLYYKYLLQIVVFLLPISVFQLFFTAILNGFQLHKKVIRINVCNSIFVLLITAIGLVFFGLKGAMFATALAGLLGLVVSGYYVLRTIKGKKTRFKYDHLVFDDLKKYALMMLFSGIIAPAFLVVIRKLILQKNGLWSAGIWEALNRLSNNYMLFVSTLITVYFLPKLMESSTNYNTKQILKEYYKQIIPLLIVGFSLLLYWKKSIIQLVFSADFSALNELIVWQCMADFCKACAWILAYYFMAKKMSLHFIISEILANVLNYAMANVGINLYGIKGIVMANTVQNLVYLIGLLIYFRWYLSRKTE